jgi:hypothetical protein
VLLIRKSRSQYVRIKNPLLKQSEKACMCFYTRCVRTGNFTVTTGRISWWFFYNFYCPDGSSLLTIVKVTTRIVFLSTTIYAATYYINVHTCQKCWMCLSLCKTAFSHKMPMPKEDGGVDRTVIDCWQHQDFSFWLIHKNLI